MKIGVKIYNEFDFARYFANKADFLEVMALEGVDYKKLRGFPLPIVIHAMHHGAGGNPADKTRQVQNLKYINLAIKTADLLNSKKIILHPGHLIDENCSVKNAIDFIKEIRDDRLLLENLPGNFKHSIFTSPIEIKGILQKTGKGFCLDFNHAIFTAISSKQDYFELIKELLKLNPRHFHIGGQKLNINCNAHLPLKESEFDIKKILNLTPKGAEITLETTTSTKEVEEDLNLIRELLNGIR